MGAYGTVQWRMDKTVEKGRDCRKNHMRIVYLVSCPSPAHGARRTRKEILFSGAVPGQKGIYSRLVGCITRGRNESKD